MKVGLLTTGFPRFEGDCSGAFLLTLARGLVEQGHSVRVLAPEPARARPRPHWPGIDLTWLPYGRPRGLQRTFYGSGAPDNLRRQPARWAGAVCFAAALDRAAPSALEDCDALLSSWCVPNGWVASRTAQGRPHLCICHATDVRWLSKLPGGRTLARRIAAGASSLWFLSTAIRDQFWDTAALDPSTMTCHIGSMPIDRPPPPRKGRAALRRQLGIEGFTLLFLGRLVPVKGVDELLHALSRLPRTIGLRIAGDGPERARLQGLARRLEVHATFEGWAAGERKEALLRACDALVVPSRPNDGLPTVLFEARARGLPIVSTAGAAISEQLGGAADTMLVPPNDRNALARAIQQLHASYESASPLRARPFGCP
jgi:glycosyltransferase involved in cell wall biosynthesis